jgi:hypothetical protein
VVSNNGAAGRAAQHDPIKPSLFLAGEQVIPSSANHVICGWHVAYYTTVPCRASFSLINDGEKRS